MSARFSAIEHVRKSPARPFVLLNLIHLRSRAGVEKIDSPKLGPSLRLSAHTQLSVTQVLMPAMSGMTTMDSHDDRRQDYCDVYDKSNNYSLLLLAVQLRLVLEEDPHSVLFDSCFACIACRI